MSLFDPAVAATIAGFLVGILTVLQLSTKGVEFLLNIPERLKARKRRKTLIIFPSTEEIARYSVKLSVQERPLIREIEEDRQREIARWIAARNKVKIAMVKFVFLVIFSILYARLIYYAYI